MDKSVLFLMLPMKWQVAPLAPWKHQLTFSLFVFRIQFFHGHCQVSYCLSSATLEKNLYPGQWKWFNILYLFSTFYCCFREESGIFSYSLLYESLLQPYSLMEDIFGFMWLFPCFSKASLFINLQTPTTIHLITQQKRIYTSIFKLISLHKYHFMMAYSNFFCMFSAIAFFGMRNSLAKKIPHISESNL